MRQLNRVLLIGAMLSVSACWSKFQGTYKDPNAVEIIDEYWNETDARQTAEVLINEMLSRPWLNNFKGEKKAKPIVITKDTENRTSEHLDTQALNEFIRNQLINSGSIRFVDAASRDKILKEIQYQEESGMVAQHTRKKKGKQIGADFFLSGAISAQEHSKDGVKTVTYQTNLILTDLETSEIVWSGTHRVSKKFQRSRSVI